MSGPYVGSWFSLPLGTQHDDGFELSVTTQGQEVNETDAYGMTLVEAIYRGFNWRARFRGLEWKSGLVSVMQEFGQINPGTTALSPVLTNVGDRWSKYNGALVLTAILGNPPTIPQSLTATNAGISPNSQSAFNMTSKMRELPIELCLLPYVTVISSVSYTVPFSST